MDRIVADVPAEPVTQQSNQRIENPDSVREGENEADRRINSEADKSATRSQETIKRYEENHNIFTK